MTRAEILQAAKPILFNTEMVQAILDGRKTETRRVIKPACPGGEILSETPPYKPRDYLYVRETWKSEGDRYYYRADYDNDYLEPCETITGATPIECSHHPGCEGCTKGKTRIRWRPSIHMPKEAARIFLQVTDVRAERLQEITEEGAKAEGICEEWARSWWKPTYNDPDSGGYPMYRDTFAYDLWDSTIQPKDRDKYGWDADPWVWVIEFERIKQV